MVNYEKELARQNDAEESYRESSDESMAMDSQMNRGGLPSNISPENLFEYKKMVLIPESQAAHPNEIDKDIVFANLGGAKPSFEELSFQLGTIQLARDEFVVEREIPRRNMDGSFVRDREGFIIFDVERVFDEAFRGTLNYLEGQYKYAHVGSRALGGQERAAYMDAVSIGSIKKEFMKKKDNQGKTFGLGGM